MSIAGCQRPRKVMEVAVMPAAESQGPRQTTIGRWVRRQATKTTQITQAAKLVSAPPPKVGSNPGESISMECAILGGNPSIDASQ